MTITTDTNQVTLPPVRDTRAGFAGEVARLQQENEELRVRMEAQNQTITALRTEQITDGADPRLIEFWDKAGRIADHADFCHEYDRIAEAMNGTPRTREYDVEVTLSITVTLSLTVEARNEDGAEEEAREAITYERIADEVRTGTADFEIDEYEVTEA